MLTALSLEATMLGVMLFGRGRVSERTHTIATLSVAAGTSLSAFWILARNAWMNTPAGFEMIDGKAHVTSWLAVIFNPLVSLGAHPHDAGLRDDCGLSGGMYFGYR